MSKFKVGDQVAIGKATVLSTFEHEGVTYCTIQDDAKLVSLSPEGALVETAEAKPRDNDPVAGLCRTVLELQELLACMDLIDTSRGSLELTIRGAKVAEASHVLKASASMNSALLWYIDPSRMGGDKFSINGIEITFR